jgi:hypothetical protein
MSQCQGNPAICNSSFSVLGKPLLHAARMRHQFMNRRANGAKRVTAPEWIILFRDYADQLSDKNAKRNRSNSPSAQFRRASFP